MAVNWGYISSDGPNYTDVTNGVSDNLVASTGSFTVGQQSQPTYFNSFLSFLEFDTSNLPTAPDELYLCVFNPSVFPDSSNAFNLKVALHDYGNTFDETLWMTPAELSALSTFVATVSATASVTHWFIPLDLGLITLGGTIRLVLFTDKQASATAPLCPSPDFIGIETVTVNSGFPRLLSREFYTSPGSVSDWQTEVLADSPDLFWRLNESSGVVASDSSGNSSDGTYINNPTLGVTGYISGDLAIQTSNADDSHVESITDFNGQDFTSTGLTMETVLSAQDFSSSSIYFPLMGFESNDIEHDIETWGTDDLSGNQFVAYEMFPANNDNTLGFTFVEPDTSLHIVWAIAPDGDYRNSRMYVNGDEYRSCDATPATVSTGDLNFVNPVKFYGGGDPFGGDSMDGILDELVLYGHQLSSTRVRVHYAATGGSITPGPVITSTEPAPVILDTGPVTIALHGTGFTGTTSVTFDNQSVSFTVFSSTLITFSATGSAGSHSIVVTTPNGTTSTSISFSNPPPTFSANDTRGGSGGLRSKIIPLRITTPPPTAISSRRVNVNAVIITTESLVAVASIEGEILTSFEAATENEFMHFGEVRVLGNQVIINARY